MKLGFIGAGKMGSALLGGALRTNFCRPEEVLVHDVHAPSVQEASTRWPGIRSAASNREIFAESDLILVCVKPQDVRATLAEAASEANDRLVISIAAGIALEQLESWSENRHRVVRVMPNTPALVGQGASAFALGLRATEADSDTVTALFGGIGVATRVKEEQLDAVTGLSGSGPAYIYTIIEALSDGGVREGLPRALSLQLAAQTVAGAAAMVLQTGEHPAALRDQVTSPGGTTIAGLAKLEEKGLRSALIEAVRAATQRSKELRG
jgi:pyrroline-5-carboxylate reductase